MTGFVVAYVERVVADAFPRLDPEAAHDLAQDLAVRLVGEPASEYPLLVTLAFDEHRVGGRLPDLKDRLSRVVDALTREAD